MWSLYLGLILCVVSFLPAIFDHGVRRANFRSAAGVKEKWVTGLKWIIINWGLPILAITVTIAQGLESAATDKQLTRQSNELSSLKVQLESQQNPPFALRLKSLFEEIDPKIMQGISNGVTTFRGGIPDGQKQALRRFASDSNNAGLLMLQPDINFTSLTADEGTIVSVEFIVSPDFIRKIASPPMPRKKPN